MKDVFTDTMVEFADGVRETIIEDRVDAEKKATFWKILFVVTVAILGIVVAGVAICTILKKKFDKDILAGLKARFSREIDDLDFLEAVSEDVSVELVD